MPSDRPHIRVLFVCWGNICRSPAAENVFRQVLAASAHAGRIGCDSAGTIDAHTGKPPDPRMRRTLERRGIPVRGKARCIDPGDFARFDLILTMDDFNRREVLALARTASERARVRPFVSFCRRHDHPEVPDPYYGGDDGFETVVDLIEDGCAGLLDHLAAQLA
jgi:protein-tyrosine phosphatase